MPLKIVRNDITRMRTEAIVNTANEDCVVGAGCDTAIYNAAGFEELLEYRCSNIGYVPEGEAFCTPGFNLSAKYIIHAVSPMYIDGHSGEENKLRSCYRKSLAIAFYLGVKSVAFPLLATGSFGYPKEQGMRIAADEINSFLMQHDMEIYLVVFGTEATLLGERLYPDLEAYIDHNYVEKKLSEEYWDEHRSTDTTAFGGRDEYLRVRADLERRRPVQNAPRADMAAPQAVHMPSLLRHENAVTPDKAPEARQLKAKPLKVRKSKADEVADKCDALCEPQGAAHLEKAEAAEFDEGHESELKKRLAHLSDNFRDYLFFLIEEKKLENVEVYHKSLLDKKVFSKIKNNPDYHPKKLTALCLCIGMELSLDETVDLLARAGYALSPSDITDVIFSYFIENKIYDMVEIDIQLEEHGVPCIIQ